MKFNFLGGAMEVGGSSVLLEINDKKILLDAGIRQSANVDKIPDYKTVQEKGGLDYIIISHAHMDHIGTLPIISKAYPQAPIYMTAMTKMLTRVLLYDSLKIMEQEDGIPSYAEEDVISMLDRIIPLDYNIPLRLCPEIKFQFYPAGHIAGASLVHIMAEEGSVLYTGDYSGFSQRTIEGALVPKINADVMITETTYGTTLHSNRQVEENKIIELASQCIQNNGKMLIPVFALGRAQEIIMILKSAINRKLIPEVKIYVDGLVRKINSAYLSSPLFLKNSLGKQIFKGINPFSAKYIHEVTPTDNRDDFFKDDAPAIFVASSGMLTGGASVYYAKKIISEPNGYIVITGYQDEDAPGRSIVNLLGSKEKNPKMVIDGTSFPVRCHLEKAGLSAHADKDEISGLIQKVMPSHLFLVHGSADTIESYSEDLKQNFHRNIWLPSCGEECEVMVGSKKYKQRVFLPKFKMDNVETLSFENVKKLWDFIIENYGQNALFTAQQIFYIWYGKRTVSEKKISAVQNILLNSAWFEPNPRRLFQFRPKTLEQIDEKKKDGELNIQELGNIINQDFADYPFKKISINQDLKEITLVFDFPHAVNKSIQTLYDEFTAKTNWKISNNENINTTAVNSLLKELFGDRVSKISYFIDKCMVSAEISPQSENDKELFKKFDEFTGFKLVTSGNKNTINKVVNTKAKGVLVGTSVRKKKRLEQNQAFAVIESMFQNNDIKPYKKGIKYDNNGSYIELMFITPQMGNRCVDIIENISNETGWVIKISDSVNQIEVLNIVSSLCSKLNIKIFKNPSYMVGNQSVKIKIEQGQENFEELKKLVYEKTGLEITYVLR